MKIKLKIRYTNTFLIYILVFSIIFQSGTVQAANNPDSIMFKVTRLFMLIISLMICLKSIACAKVNEMKNYIICFSIFEILALINYILYPASAIELQYKIVLFLFFFWLGKLNEKKQDFLENVFLDIIVLTALFTIVLYFLIEILHIGIPYTKYEGINILYRNYFNIFYSYSTKRIPRICGIFWEPGVYQIYLNLGLYLYYYLNKKKIFYLGVLVINIIFTQSTTGYIIAAVILANIIIQSGIVSKYYNLFMRISIGVIAVVFAIGIFMIKRKTTNTIGDSFYDRIHQNVTGIKIFMENPVFGTGFYNTGLFSSLNKAGSGNANGLLTWAYTTGTAGLLVAIVPYLYGIYKTPGKSGKRKKIIFFIYILLVNFTEPIYALPINVFFLSREYYSNVYRKRYTNYEGQEAKWSYQL